MHGMSSSDPGMAIDWGRASADYGRYRPGYPPSFWERVVALGVGRAGQRVLDLGTGTGVLAREFARRGCEVVGIDVSEGQVAEARRLADLEKLRLDLRVAPAERTGLPDAALDAITASQCWLYFDKSLVIPEVKRLLAPGGRLMTCHICWLPRLDPIARKTEELVLKYNPSWTAADWAGVVPLCPEWAKGHFEVTAMFYYGEQVPFTRETWRGRIRACRGVGASISEDRVAAFDAELDAMLRGITREQFTILHQIDAHILAPSA